MKKTLCTLIALVACSVLMAKEKEESHKSFSGIYPHLAFYNTGGECGTGAVVPWAGHLWCVTYSPHAPYGSDDKLYEITPELKEYVREESIGGTPANRMIHRPSQQLFIGPYVIDKERKVRVMPYTQIPGRPTGLATHLTDSIHRILYATMEAGFYDIDVHTLEPITLYKDGNILKEREGAPGLCALFPGYHGKGFYSGQGVAVYSNNGEEGELARTQFDIPAGSLDEWDGHTWKMVRRCQFTEVTGPGGIEGNDHPDTDPIWSLGWDYRSLILAIREVGKGWSYYRLPKCSFAYDGAHGWNTEWPRIRNVSSTETPEYLMTMHGMFWHFPAQFSTAHSSGIRPRGAYLKVIGDFTEWNGRLVFGCDDSAMSEFLNKRAQKGNIGGPGQSNSNLWFTSPDQPDHVGPTTAGGSLWLRDTIQADVPSDPFMFCGWEYRCAWIANHSGHPATITFQVDKEGEGRWETLRTEIIQAHESRFLPFGKNEKGTWIRAISDTDIVADLTFMMTPKEHRSTTPDPIFRGLASIDKTKDSGGLLYGLPHQRRALGIAASTLQGECYYELDSLMNLCKKQDPEMQEYIRQSFAIPRDVVTIDDSSILITDQKQRRWRLPLGPEAYTRMTAQAQLRLCREVATERDLFSLHGTFYELPAENADGFAKIRPMASHRFAIHDYASYRGLLVMTGIDHAKAQGNTHIVRSDDQQMAVWAGAIDDLWKMGKPTGHGGPWKETPVQPNEWSDPFLIGYYDKRQMELYHTSAEKVTFHVEVDPTGDGQWFHYKNIEVQPNERVRHRFPKAFQARWIRFSVNKKTTATTYLKYE